jgi:hypothetical protein
MIRSSRSLASGGGTRGSRTPRDRRVEFRPEQKRPNKGKSSRYWRRHLQAQGGPAERTPEPRLRAQPTFFSGFVRPRATSAFFSNLCFNGSLLKIGGKRRGFFQIIPNVR